MKLYSELASWWPLLSPPGEYAEEAGIYYAAMQRASDGVMHSLLELGCGGGNNASHMKRHFDDIVLTDVSTQMLALSRSLNPECTHVAGDMRRLRLDREFDCVFVHDAICYMTTEADLRDAITTAFLHCRSGGVALFCPDKLRETFAPSTDDGGEDGPDRALRYLEWMWDPDPTDTTYVVHYAYMLRHPDGSVTVEHDRHIEGLFGRGDWLRLLTDAGFTAQAVPFDHSELPTGSMEMFVARRP